MESLQNLAGVGIKLDKLKATLDSEMVVVTESIANFHYLFIIE